MPTSVVSSKPMPVRPPGPKGRPLVGNLPEFRNDPASFLEKIARRYGDVVYIPIGRQHIYYAGHPDVVRDILVTNQTKFKKSRMLERAKVLLGEGLLTSEGEHHKRQRRLVQPAFHRERLAGYCSAMADIAGRRTRTWEAGRTFDVAEEMARLTLAVVGRTLFSSDVESEADEIGT